MKIKKTETNKRRRLFITVAAVAFVASVFVFVTFFLQKKTYVTTDLFVTGGEWWWDTIRAPYWLGDPVVSGATEYDVAGKKIVEILDVQKFDEGSRRSMIIKARLLVSKDIRTKKYRFKQNPLEIGATISISPGNIQIYANIIGIEGVHDLGPEEKQVVVARWYNVFPWQAEAIQVGDTMTNGSNKEVARVIKKEEQSAQRTVISDTTLTGQLVFLRNDPDRRDVTLTLEILTTQSGRRKIFNYSQLVKVGETLYIALPKINILPQIISLTPSL